MVIPSGTVVKVNETYNGLRGHLYHRCIGEVVSSRQLSNGVMVYGVVIYLDHAKVHRYMHGTEIDTLIQSS